MKHEAKYCPRCHNTFECKVGLVSRCQCSAAKLDDADRNYIRSQFSDCLCVACIKALQSEFREQKLTNKLKRLLRKIIG